MGELAVPGAESQTAELFIRYMSNFTVPVLPPSDDFNVYPVPVISAQQIDQLKQMLKEGSSVLDCCKFLTVFEFDPAIVNAVRAHQLGANIDLYLLANTIAWIANDAFHQADYFILLIEALISLGDQFVKAGGLCMKLLCSQVDAVALPDIPPGIVCSIRNFLSGINCGVRYMISILMHLLRNANKARNEGVYREVIHCLSKTIVENASGLVNYDFIEIIEEINELVENVDVDGMELFGAVADVNGTGPLLRALWNKLAVFVVRKLNELKRTEFVVEHETPQIAIPSELTDVQLSVQTFKSFPTQREPLPNERFESNIEATDILTEEQFRLMSACQVLVHRKFKEPVDIFLETFSKHLSSMEVCYCFLSMIENLVSYTMPSECLDNLLKCGIFSLKFTVFYEEQFDLFGGLRNKLLRLLLKKYDGGLSSLREMTRNSVLYVENLLRMRNITTEFERYFNGSTVVDIARLFQIILFSLSVTFTKELYAVWSTLFAYSVSLAEKSSVNHLLFSSVEFTGTLLQHFWHKPLRNLMFSLLRTYITQPNSILGGISKFCETIFHSALFREDEQYHSVTIELIQSLEDAMSHRQEIVPELSSITPRIIAFLLKFPTKELLNCTLNFLTLVSFNCGGISFSHKEMLKLGETIRSTEADGLSESTKTLLMALIAGTKNTVTSFNIRNPSFILLFLNASSDDISELIETFYRLSKFSIHNCIQCHKSEIDLVLIQLLYSYPNPFKFMDCVFRCKFNLEQIHEIVIPFLSLIFTYSCSPQTVERFVGLSVPLVKGKQLALEGSWEHRRQSDFDSIHTMFQESSNSLTDLIDTRPKVRIDSVQFCDFEDLDDDFRMQDSDCVFGTFADEVLDHTTRILLDPHVIQFTFTKKAQPLVFDGINLSQIQPEFCFSCYILIDQQVTTMERAILFQISDSEGPKVILYTNGKSVICETHADKISSASLSSFLQSCQWTMITISLVKNEDSSAHLWFSMNKDPALVSTVRNPVFVDPVLSVKIGGFVEDNVSNDRVFCFLGPFRLFSRLLVDADVARLYGCGLKGDPYFKDILHQDIDVPVSYIESFSRVFRLHNIGVSLIPAFAFMNVAPPFFIEKIVDLLQFANCEKYYGVIAQFLLRCDTRCLTYSLYLRFFNLFTECLSHPLFKLILFNFGIWCACTDPMHVKRIVSHWNQRLFPDFSSYFRNLTTISEILGNIRVFFWFSKDESEVISSRRNPDLDIATIRDILNHLLVKFAATQLSDTDVVCLVSNILTTHDISQKMSFLSLLGEISDLLPAPMDCVSRLHPLFNTANTELFALTIKTILRLTKPEEISTQVELMQAHMLSIHFTRDAFNVILSLCDSYPEMLTLACQLAVNIDEETESLVREKLSSAGGDRLVKVKTWYIWPVIVLLKSPSNEQEVITRVIFELMMLDRRYIDEVLGFIDLVGVKYHVNVTPVIFRMIKELCNDLTEELRNKAKTIYRCSRYLLFRFSDIQFSETLWNAFCESPYYSGEASPCDAREFRVSGIGDLCGIVEFGTPPLLFGVPMDSESLPIFNDVVDTLASFLETHEIEDPMLKRYGKFFQYLKRKCTLSDEKKFHKLQKLTNGLSNGIQVMNISFNGSFLKGMKAELLKYLKNVSETAAMLMSNVDEAFIQSALDSIESIAVDRMENYAKAHNCYNFFKNQYMNTTSIWRCFHGKLPSLQKSFRLLDNYTCTGYRTRYVDFEVDPPPVTVKGIPVFLRKARLVKFNVTYPVKFAILPDRVVIGYWKKVVIIPAKDVKMVLQRPPTSFEIVTFAGKTYLIAFSSNVTSDLLSAFKMGDFAVPLMQSSIFPIFVQKLNLTLEWMKGKITNFDYIMRLNYFGGRSFNCPSKYPIFPLLQLPDGSIRDLDKKLEIDPRAWLRCFVGFSSAIVHDSAPQKPETVTFDVDHEPAESENTDEDETKSSDESSISDGFSQLFERGHLELTPEFYSTPEAFSGLIKPSEYKFVYEMRKFLESDEVTANLHLWIDHVFGYKSSGTTVLFRNAHPQKPPTMRPDGTKQRQYFDIVLGNATYASLSLLSDRTLLFHAITNDSLASTGTITWDKESRPIVKISQTREVTLDSTVITTVSKCLVLIDPSISTVQLIGQDISKTLTVRPLYPTNSCAENGLCYSEHGVVYHIEKTRKNEISIFGVCKISPESPVCACSSPRHNITAVGVRSGRILIYERSSGNYIREIASTGDTPRHIGMCATFPLVVVQYETSLKVYSIYGPLIGETSITFEISLMVLGESRDGFDHIFISDATGRILHIEVMTLRVTELMKYGSRILAMRYVSDMSVLFAFTQEGRGFCIPLVL